MNYTLPTVVFHATTAEHIASIKTEILIDRPDAKTHLDFGKGFYTSTNLDQALSRASDLQEARRNPNGVLAKKDRGVVLQFDLNQDLLYSIDKGKYKIFPFDDEEWAKFVVYNRAKRRNGTPFVPHSFEWTYGPMADGPTWSICQNNFNGLITIDELLNGYNDPQTGENTRGIRPYVDGYDQLVFHNDQWVNQVLTNCKIHTMLVNVLRAKGG
ncbi:DUF3990 domain-containing protein [Paenibacillus odorifer]|uniref:DUF3990 domain-containing protein n=1 Tax=Paenibacillus odorifer TaxID=189426 RepID=UPI00096DD728|nr:DUF3990 domain-containing protein [Paenibacillus odorifer]OME13787.1 hypothetical protein BSK57_29410 [Paenibacillus odorifer]